MALYGIGSSAVPASGPAPSAATGRCASPRTRPASSRGSLELRAFRTKGRIPLSGAAGVSEGLVAGSAARVLTAAFETSNEPALPLVPARV